MKTMFAVALAVALSAGFCSPLFAQKGQSDSAGLFKKLDADGNGQLSLEEFAASQKPVDKQSLEKKLAQKKMLAEQQGKQPVDSKAPMKEGAVKKPGETDLVKKFDKHAAQKNVKKPSEKPGDVKKPVKKSDQPDGGKKVDKKAPEGKQPDQKKPDAKDPVKKQPEKNAEKSEKVDK